MSKKPAEVGLQGAGRFIHHIQSQHPLVGRIMTTIVSVSLTDTKLGTLALSIEVGGVWIYQWSPKHLETLAKRIAGIQKQEALALVLREAGVQTTSIRLTGSEQTTLPTDPSRIIIVVRSL